MRAALDLIQQLNPDFPVDGEMQADTRSRKWCWKDRCRIRRCCEANLLDHAECRCRNITYNALRMVAGGASRSGQCCSERRGLHILTPASTVRRVVNACQLSRLSTRQRQLSQRRSR
jgi:malate dehydrogenase (oxaloacetate-decarboxylating)(NADP+)